VTITGPIAASKNLDDVPSIKLERIRQQCLSVLSLATSILQRKVVESLRHRLSELLNAQEWDDADTLPSFKSFRSLLLFFGHNELRAPALTISNEGKFVATWLKTRKDITRLEFDDVGWVKWIVLLSPIGRNEQQYIKGTGTAPADQVKKTLQIHDVWRWMSRVA
jgi:hypothetical protein